ncbi:hypothetical protein, partial [Cellulomonas sp. P5_C6]
MYRRIVTTATALGLGLVLAAAGPSPAVGASATAEAPDPTSTDRPHDRGTVPAAKLPANDNATPAADHVLVKFAPSTSGTQQRSALEAVGGSRDGSVPGTPYV